jgi:hypothetical protein
MNSTTIPAPTFTELTNDIYAVMLAHRTDPRFDYFVDAFAAVMKSHRVTRLDLWELLNAVTDFGRVDDLDHFTDLNARIAITNVNRVFASMDAAAAFATTDYPLVIRDLGRDAFDFSVTAADDSEIVRIKHLRQTPSAPSYREYIAR